MDKPSLKNVFQNDFYIGAALNVEQITGLEPEAMDVVARHFNSITPENIMKWEEIHPEPGRYNFDISDQFVAFGEEHNMHIIGHALVWHEQTPDWVFQDESGNRLSREALLERMKDHIFTVVGRYKGRIHGWDVVNEAVMKDGSMRKSKWFEIVGEDFVQKAFEYAREADPDAELYYNEYEYEHISKTEGVIRLVDNLQSNGVKVDGVGIQGHWLLDFPEMELIDEYVNKLRKLGVNLMITEMDVGVIPFCPPNSPVDHISSFDIEKQKAFNPYPKVLPNDIQEELAKRYVEFFSYFRKNRDIFSRITLWAVHDGQTWRNYWPIKGRADHPMLFDRQCRPKPALDALIRFAK
ncbi:MAG: endo-1,4-beta-xylanase [Prolixibacteraceae bacterium]|nr:endo-1,4-beta-xylanase [Prolixibacteraceae bacterium]